MRSRWLALPLALALCAAAPLSVRAGEDDTNPHHMKSPDDDEGCGFCHEDDMSLSASLLDTCLTCHSITEHSGSQEHIHATAADVARLQPTPIKAGAEPTLPLSKEGTIWCGTCHLYHDPQVNEEALLPESWHPPSTGIAGAVGAALEARWGELAGKYDQPLPVARLSEHGTAALRLPVSDGRLCTECHSAQYQGQAKYQYQGKAKK
jgi:hypothetical protein